jgi:hypothetical protein
MMRSAGIANNASVKFESMGFGLKHLSSDEAGDIFDQLDTRDGTRGCNSSPIAGINEGSPYLDGVRPDVVFEIDATKTASYSGTGDDFFNLIETPSDGSSQADLHWLLDNAGTTGENPIFYGSAGTSSAYFGFTSTVTDEGGFFKTVRSGNDLPQFFKDLHKSQGGTWTLAFVAKLESDHIPTLFSTMYFSDNTRNSLGMMIEDLLEDQQIEIYLGDNSLNTGFSSGTSFGPIDITQENLYIISASKTNTNIRIRMWENDSLIGDHTRTYVHNTLANPTTHAVIGAADITANNATYDTGTFTWAAGMTRFLTDSDQVELLNYVEATLGRDFTP